MTYDPYTQAQLANATAQANALNIGTVGVGIGGAGSGGGWVSASPSTSAYPTPTTAVYERQVHTREQLIYMRLNNGCNDYLYRHFDDLHCTRIADDKMAVFVVVDGKYAVLEDDANLFPSDTLVTALRLLGK